MNLEVSELLNIRGGAKSSLGGILFLIFGGLVTVFAGIIDGMTNPTKCRNR